MLRGCKGTNGKKSHFPPNCQSRNNIIVWPLSRTMVNSWRKKKPRRRGKREKRVRKLSEKPVEPPTKRIIKSANGGGENLRSLGINNNWLNLIGKKKESPPRKIVHLYC